MTGRYKLTEKFDASMWMENVPMGCVTYWYSNEAYPSPTIHTFFFKFTNQEIDRVKTLFERMVTNDIPDAMEYVMYQTLKGNLKDIEEIGIEVRWSCFNIIRQA